MHSTYIVTLDKRAPDGKRVECYQPCCQGCGWVGQIHAARRNAKAEEHEHQPAIF